MPRPILATIRLGALRRNFAVARARAGRARIWAVLKANAYGHGLERVAGALAEVADGFAVLDLDEAVGLREAGIRQPVLLLEGFFQPADLEVVARYALTPVIHRTEQIEVLAAARLPQPLEAYLKFNSGMNRLGFKAGDFAAAYRRLRSLAGIRSVGLMTHFAAADLEQGIAEPLAAFERARLGLAGAVSLANSAALLRYPQACGDWVRPGIMLYGGSPFGQHPAEELGLHPVMTLSAEIIAVQHLDRGERVGYGGLFSAERPTRIGVVACGYADGYPRHAGSGTPILVAGRRTRILGRVSMDMLVADLTGIPEAGIGTPVVLWGEGLPADEVAEAAGTLSYELFCALAPRVPIAVEP
ncbi:MAG: alanine racemase [Rhodocyclaceae bacterium]